MIAAIVLALTLFLQTDAQGSTYCAPGEMPLYRQGFLTLYQSLGADASRLMGPAITCEIGDPKGTGDTLQYSTRGLAYYRQSTNTPTFTDGYMHWALTPVGVAYWFGGSFDPPADADVVHQIAVEDLRP